MKRTPLAVLSLAALAFIICVWQRISPPVLALEVRDSLGLTPDGMSLIFALTFFGYGLMQPVAGYLVDRFGPRRCLLASCLVMGLSSMLFSWAHSFPAACLARAVMGLAAGLALMPGLRLCLNWLPPERFSMAVAAMFSATTLSTVMAGRPLAQVSAAFGWRWPFFWVGVASLGLALLVWLVVSDRPAAGGPAVAAPEGAKLSFRQSAALFMGDARFWLLGGLYIGTDCLFHTFTSLWAGPWLMEVHGLKAVAVGDILSVGSVCFLVGPPLIALWAGKWGSGLKVLLVMAAFNVACAAFIMRGPASLGLGALYALCFLAPLGGQAPGLVMDYSREAFPAAASSTAMGCLNFLTIMGGAVFQQAMGRVLATAPAAWPARDAYALAFLPVALWAALALALGFILLRKK